MARLNEPAAPTESIESLKRKFMRQNRDIARANSTQSLRIRNLENEISKLLADNLGLREHILHLQNELENGMAQRVANQAGVIKSQLEAKLLEIGELITGLGDEATRKKQSPRASKLMRASPKRSPDQKNWRNMCTLSEAVANQEGRLPPIPENKTYPRRTLELQELTAILAEQAAGSTDSPEIGPPPVSQFVDEDPVKIDLLAKARMNENEDLSTLDPVLSANLEQRKKRRDSTSISETRKSNKFEPANSSRENTGSLKTGAKRKLSVREDEESENSTRSEVSPDDSFSYTRLTGEVRSRLGPPAEKAVSKVAREIAVARGAPRDKPTTISVPSRKVLAPKSVNDSPRKSARQQIVDEVKIAKAEVSKANPVKERSREKRQESVPIKSAIGPVPDTVEIQPEPETPAALDLFSPISSQPSTARADSRDTPPPPDLGLGTEGQRPSRRARGAVSYAEPNLRDKMRRPTKELVDAVAREAAHQTAFIKLEDVATNNVKIKAEPESDDAWKSLPVPSSVSVEASSPLSGKTIASTPTILPSGLISHRKRRESSSHHDTGPPRVGSGGVISALLAGTRRTKIEPKEKSSSEEAALAKSMLNLDVYDFRGSPSPEEDSSVKAEKEVKAPSRQSRRQSSTPRDLVVGDDGDASDIEASKKTSSFASRRRTSTLGQRGSSMSKEPTRSEEPEKSSKTASSATSDDEAGLGGRADRVSRRRSMMI